MTNEQAGFSNTARMVLNIKSWENLQSFLVVAVFKKGISSLKDFLVFIMDRFIQDMVCLQRVHLPS